MVKRSRRQKLLERVGLALLSFAAYPTCLGANCRCAQGWPCLDCDPTETEAHHACPTCGRDHYLAKEGQDRR